ncbi:MAG TPA: HAD-IIIC family phosphatase [Woeseiaceae bacterium]
MSVAAADTRADVDDLRCAILEGPLATGDVERHWRRLCALAPSPDLRVAWLGNHTLEPALRHATVLAFAHGVSLASEAGDFGQHFQAVLDPGSALHAALPDAIVLSLSLRLLAPALVTGGAGLAEETRRAEAVRVLDDVRRWVDAARERTPATLLVTNFPRPARSGYGLADAQSAAGDAALYGWLNESLAAEYRDDPQVHVLDADAAIANAGRAASWNPAMYHLAKIEWHGPGLAAVAELLARALCALVRPAKKCLLLDLDNTLWGGIVGEDGVEGLRIGAGDPAGEAFLDFQRALLDIKARGVLLGLVSKNNREDVEEAYRRLDMPLALSDFAATRIDWQQKHLHIADIAGELGIGLDSVVFVDDNPVECELARRALPEVEVIALPGDPAAYAEILLGSWLFDKLALTEEDAQKTIQYRDNAARARGRHGAADLAAWLESLGTRIEIGRAGAGELTRLHQLFGKTNQFNVTTKRYTAAELRRFAESDAWLFEWLRVRDNFGDLGLVGAWLVRLNGGVPEIDSFLLSCRALGRGVETAAVNRIKERVFASGAEALVARFVPTAKNRPAERFYDEQGFALVDTGPDGVKTYRITAADAAPRPCAVQEIIVREEGG